MADAGSAVERTACVGPHGGDVLVLVTGHEITADGQIGDVRRVLVARSLLMDPSDLRWVNLPSGG